jgi:hypothetical protein
MRFYLGVHKPAWVAATDVPLFLSYRRLAGLRRLPRARGPYAIDSGGFSELSMNARWTFSAARYADDVRRFAAEIGPPDFVAVQDYMCEAAILAKTGLTVEEHQKRTIASYLELRELAPEIPWAPVLQGWTWGDYEDHVASYERAGVDLRALPIVGVGSICRRQQTTRAAILLRSLASEGLRVHAFGMKVQGLAAVADCITSADSMAWSYGARRQRRDGSARLTNCPHASCANCLDYALVWRALLLERLGRRAA